MSPLGFSSSASSENAVSNPSFLFYSWPQLWGPIRVDCGFTDHDSVIHDLDAEEGRTRILA